MQANKRPVRLVLQQFMYLKQPTGCTVLAGWAAHTWWLTRGGLDVLAMQVLIFSQFKMMLDVLEDYLAACDYPYERIDGETTPGHSICMQGNGSWQVCVVMCQTLHEACCWMRCLACCR